MEAVRGERGHGGRRRRAAPPPAATAPPAASKGGAPLRASELAPQRCPRAQHLDLCAHGGGPLRLPIGRLAQHCTAAGGHPPGARVAIARPACDMADRLDAAMTRRAARHHKGVLGAAAKGGGDGRQELHRVSAAHARHRAAAAAAAVYKLLRGGNADSGVRVEEVAAARMHGAHRVHRESIVDGCAAYPLSQPGEGLGLGLGLGLRWGFGWDKVRGPGGIR